MERLINKILENEENKNELIGLVTENEIPSKTILLHEGEIATNIHYIKKGCLGLWFNKDGKDITLQFFSSKNITGSEKLIQK